MKSIYSLVFMKIKNNLVAKLILGAGLVVGFSFLNGCATNSSTSDQMKPMKGGEHQMMLNKAITTTGEAEAVKPDDSFAMACGKCKTVYITRVKQGEKGAQILMQGGRSTELIGTHACNSCGGTWTIVGVGKGATSILKHTCSACGDDSAFCCATKAGSATKGMEKQ